LEGEREEMEMKGKCEGSWNYFSFSDINESEFDDKKNFQKYSDESTVEDFAKLEAMTQNWKSPSIGAGYQSLFSIWHY
jgi:hypothetical protein